MSSNLPPGVTESMIPGNRPEDIAEEEFWEKALTMLEEKLGKDKMNIMSARMENWDETTQAFIEILRELSYSWGANDAKMEADLNEAEKYHAGIREGKRLALEDGPEVTRTELDQDED